MLSLNDRLLAVEWYVNQDYDLQTIGQHFGLTYEEMKAEIRNHYLTKEK